MALPVVSAMNYDNWKATAPESDDCTEDAETCECPDCRTWRDNREGPEPNSEAFRGGEARAYEREQMAGYQRLK